ncbi:unnamed protein product [Prorocentrum cordatum]|uniref:Uncharacterized protein n=1 Tax=Prorocentrum cordatum TaxID=2364126 RepID=A0ABN9XI36_9DINO|nr:unnamed protein product [Polarella glacialis]
MLPPSDLRRYFALRSCRAGSLDLSVTADGHPLAGTDQVHPCFRCPPLGCAFRPRICQKMDAEPIALQSPELTSTNRFVERRPIPQVTEDVFHADHLDNLIGLVTNLGKSHFYPGSLLRVAD